MMLLIEGSKKPSITMVVIGMIDIEATLGAIGDESDPTLVSDHLHFKRQLATQLASCVRRRIRPFSELEL